jgi:MoxR-like ATPase
MDRFMMRLSLGYPNPEMEAGILATHGVSSALDDISPVMDARGISEMSLMAREVHVAGPIQHYIVQLADATRRHPDLYLGASPRASIMLLRAARAMAAADGRDYVVPDDVKSLVMPVMAHRLVVASDAAMGGRTAGSILTEVLGDVPVPVRNRT